MNRIMIIEDDEDLRGLLERRLTAGGYAVMPFATADQALVAIKTCRPNLVLTDVGLPGMDGIEACKRIRLEYPDLPVVFVTALAEVDDRVTGLEAGARDYIAKPFAARELLARVRVILREASLLATAKQRVAALEAMSLVDPLTGCSNRRYLEVRFGDEVLRSRRYERPLSCLMVDVDDFKPINDNHGHAVGDGVLVALAALLRKDLRTVDSIVRYGGEEFVIILPETPLAGALIAAERIRASIESTEVGTAKLKVTVSIGVASEATEDVLVRADRAMYVAKSRGKNRVEAWENSPSFDRR